MLDANYADLFSLCKFTERIRVCVLFYMHLQFQEKFLRKLQVVIQSRHTEGGAHTGSRAAES